MRKQWQWRLASLIVPISSVNKADNPSAQLLIFKSCYFIISKNIMGEFLLKKIKNIRVVGIAPGYTRTPMLENMNQTILEKLIKDVHLVASLSPVKSRR